MVTTKIGQHQDEASTMSRAVRAFFRAGGLDQFGDLFHRTPPQLFLICSIGIFLSIKTESPCFLWIT